jgi:hypothetical protein
MVERSEAPKLSAAAATRPSDDFHVAGVRAIRLDLFARATFYSDLLRHP